MRKELTLEKINKKISRIHTKYAQPLDDYHKGVYSGYIDALLYIKKTYKLPKI